MLLKQVCSYLIQNVELSEENKNDYLDSLNLSSKERKAIVMAFNVQRKPSEQNNSW